MPNEKSTVGRKRSRFLDPEADEAEIERRRQRVLDDLKYFEENPLPKLTDEDLISSAKSDLRTHMGIGEERPPTIEVLFFVEVAPYSSRRGAACQFVTCDKRIKEDDYRIAVHPGMNNVYKSPGKTRLRKSFEILQSEFTAFTDFYHVRCFEKLVDFSQAAYLDRITPVTRNTARLRGLKGTTIADGNYLLDGGAERLVLEWKVSMGRLMSRRDGVPDEPLEPDFDALLHKSGSASYQPKKITNMTDFEYFQLAHSLAPIESDGAEDQEEWNLFEQYLPLQFEDLEDLNERHSLSNMLSLWRVESVCCHALSSPSNIRKIC
jgi:hypothetical protein